MKTSIIDWYRNVIRNPKYRWWIIAGSIAYILSPFDLSPDFLPIVGWLDDGLIATILVAEVSQIVLERLKGKNNNATTPQAPVDVASGAQTVDVNAASVE